MSKVKKTHNTQRDDSAVSVKQQGSAERIFQTLAKHPFLCVVSMCAMLFFFGFCMKSNLNTGSYIYAGIMSALVLAELILVGNLGGSLKSSLVLYLLAAVFAGGSLYLIHFYVNSTALMLWMSVVFLGLLAVIFHLTGVLNTRTFIMLMIAAGVILRFIYVLYTDSGDRQHDVGYWTYEWSLTEFDYKWGHSNYIEYWYSKGLKLPDFDVRSIWQYYHPPLHHWLMALLLRVLSLCGMPYKTACQALQILPMIWSSLIMVVSYRIFRWVKLSGLPLIIAMAVMCFHPTFVLMGGFFNNDILCVMLMLLSVMFALRWYREPTLKRIIPIALCIGLGMMTKLNAWMVAPAIAVIFLYVFVKNIKAWKRYLGQFALFGAICAPLGLWWQVRNLIAFKVPLTYVPYLSEKDVTYCGDMSAAQRLFDFGNGQLSFVYDAYTAYGAPYDEYNPTLGLIKTSLFDEGQHSINDVNYPQIAVTGPILFWVGALLAILCFIAFIVMMAKKNAGIDGVTRVFFSVFAATMLVSYYLFCFSYPFTCTMNIRYCVPLIPLFAMGLGLLLQRFSGKSVKEKLLRYSAVGLTALFSVMSCVVYSQIS